MPRIDKNTYFCEGCKSWQKYKEPTEETANSRGGQMCSCGRLTKLSDEDIEAMKAYKAD